MAPVLPGSGVASQGKAPAGLRGAEGFAGVAAWARYLSGGPAPCSSRSTAAKTAARRPWAP